jgi:hypothetical protein
MRKLALFLLFLGQAFGYFGYPGAVFLMIWPSARPTSLGGAFVAVADDASATYYNPAGQSFQNSFNATLMHCNWLPGLYPGMYYEFLSLTHSLPKGTIGGNIIYLNTGKTEVINSRGEYLGEYTTFDLAFTLSYGYRILPKLGAGLSWKFIYSFLVPEWVWEAMPELGITSGGTGITWGFDFGLLYKPFPWLNVGTSVANLGPNISYTASGESDPIPRMLRLGVNFLPINKEYVKLSIPIEMDIGLTGFKSDSLGYEFEDAWKSIGIELSFVNMVSARIGYFEDVHGWRGGVETAKPGEEGEREVHSILSWLFGSKSGFKRLGLCYGFGLGFKNFSIDLASDYLIYSFSTSNWKISLSYKR